MIIKYYMLYMRDLLKKTANHSKINNNKKIIQNLLTK